MARSMLNTHKRIWIFLFLKRKIVANDIIVIRAPRTKRSHVISPLPMEPSVAFFTHRLYISKFSAPITLCVENSARGRNRVRVMATPARSNQRVCILSSRSSMRLLSVPATTLTLRTVAFDFQRSRSSFFVYNLTEPLQIPLTKLIALNH